MSPSRIPYGYVREQFERAHVIGRDDSLAFFREAIAAAGTMYDYAARHPDAEAIHGRQTVYLIPGPRGGRWVVRHLSHGGALAPLTGDRFLRFGTPRPFNELRLSVTLRERGIPTPAVAAAVVYPCGLIYRGEVARDEVTHARDLAACLFGETRLDAQRRLAALVAAGRLVRSLHDAGIIHPDLNLRNLLIQQRESTPRAYILDIEKCRDVSHVSGSQRQRMLDRLRRSARRFEERTGTRLTDDEWAALSEAYGGNP